MTSEKITADGFLVGHIGWKYYNQIREKAVEREFSWSGLCVSLSIAFLIVIFSAQVLGFTYKSIEKAEKKELFIKNHIYKLERAGSGNDKKYFNEKSISTIVNKILNINTAEAANADIFIGGNWGDEIKQTISIKNNSKVAWLKNETTLETGPFLKSFSKIKHDSWPKYFQLAILDKDIKPGEIVNFSVKFKIPENIEGLLQQDVQLVKANFPINDTKVRIFADIKKPLTKVKELNEQIANIIVANNAPVNNSTNQKFCIASVGVDISPDCQTNPAENDPTNGIIEHPQILQNEPIIRVGLFNSNLAQRVRVNGVYDVYAGDELILSGVSNNTETVISFDFINKQYYITTPGITKITLKQIRIIPRDTLNGIVELPDYPNRANDKQFRNIIEFRYSEITSKLWVINELPIEMYLKGLAETSNYVPVEFQKVMITAARTYAMYHYMRGVEFGVLDGSTKHASEHFHVDATYDQVYRGYASEMRLPTLSSASSQTRGAVVVYSGKIVVTPYFSRSDGRTRSWEEVWYGDPKPWLKSVIVPEDAGQTLFGHGVGLSAQGALKMVKNGRTWQDTLKYFYQGVDINKFYK